MVPKATRLDYCQFLLSSQINYTLTYLADHTDRFAHDAATRYLAGDKLTARMIWEQVKGQVVQLAKGYLVFDDTVLDKRHSYQIELVRRQWSGNVKTVIKGIGVVTCVYVNAETGEFWIVDYRIYDPDGDGKTKLDHVREMFDNAVHDKQLSFTAVLMDTWYAERTLMLHIERTGKYYYCPLKCNRLVDDSNETRPRCRIDALVWSEQELKGGKLVHIKDFPKGHQVRLFRIVLSPQRTDVVATNDPAQSDTQATQDVCGLRWKVEQFHRESKQVTGLESCQCRRARIVRNHIACALIVWARLTQVAHETQRTIYQVKHDLLDDYMRQQLRSPSIKMTFA